MPTPIEMAPLSELPILFPWADWESAEAVSVASYTVEAEDSRIEVLSHSRAGANITAWLRVPSGITLGDRVDVICSVASTGVPVKRDSRRATIVVVAL